MLAIRKNLVNFTGLNKPINGYLPKTFEAKRQHEFKPLVVTILSQVPWFLFLHQIGLVWKKGTLSSKFFINVTEKGGKNDYLNHFYKQVTGTALYG